MFVDIYGRAHRYPPPAKLMPRTNPNRFDAAEDWARIVAEGLQFEPCTGATFLVSSICGDCLEPLLIEGQHALVIRAVEPDEPFIDGGLYCIEWANKDEQHAYTDAHGLPRTERFLISKFLRFLPELGHPFGEWYCQCKDSIAPLNGEAVYKVVGVVPTESVHSGQIANNAVTDFVSAQQPIQNVTSAYNTTPIFAETVAFTPAVTGIFRVVGGYLASTSAATCLHQVEIFIRQGGTITFAQLMLAAHLPTTGVDVEGAIFADFTVTAGLATTVGMRAIPNGGNTAGTIHMQNSYVYGQFVKK
jgi:hypothetical protein